MGNELTDDYPYIGIFVEALVCWNNLPCVGERTHPLYGIEHRVIEISYGQFFSGRDKNFPGSLETTVEVLIKDLEIGLASSVGGIEKKTATSCSTFSSQTRSLPTPAPTGLPRSSSAGVRLRTP